jgi:hypothetical protein
LVAIKATPPMPDQAAIRQGLLSWGFLKKLIGLSITHHPQSYMKHRFNLIIPLHAEKNKSPFPSPTQGRGAST